MPTRRQFLLNGSALVVTASLTSTAALSAAFRPGEVGLSQISFRDFADEVNTSFRVSTGSGLVELQLLTAKPDATSRFTTNAEDAWNEKFSLLFSGPVGEFLPQDTHYFEHHRIGRFQMFIAPVGPHEPGRRYYEAVFNRPVSGHQSVRIIAERNIPSDAPRNNKADQPKTSRNT